MQSAIGANATEETKSTFGTRWQQMVKKVLENADSVITIL